jgi:peptide/nickel transport system substrate-binding protein
VVFAASAWHLMKTPPLAVEPLSEQKFFGSFLQKRTLPAFLRVTLLCTTAAAAPCGTAVIPNNIGQGDPAAPTSFNPLVGGGSITNLQAAVLLFRPLVWVGADARMDPARSLAAEVQALDGNTRFRITLKPWLWSDGKPVTADDVLYCWERILLLGDVYASAGQGGIPDLVASVRAVDATHVDVALKRAVNPAWFTLNGLSLLYALPRHAWGDLGRDEMWRRQNDPALARVVDGPFRLTALKDDRYAAYAPNTLYGGHTPTLARLVVTFLEGDNPLHAVQAGEADLARVPYALWNRLQGTAGFDFTVLPESYGYWALALNLKRDPVAFLRDVRVRRALALAVDQPAIIRLVYRGMGRENHVPVPADAAAWRSGAARAGPPALAHAAAAAAALLEAAGWRLDADGVRVRAGMRLAFTVLSNAASDDSAEMQALQVVQRNLRDVGVEMRFRRVSLDRFFDILGGAEAWDTASIFNTVPAVPDGGGVFDTGGASNFGGFSDARMDALIKNSIGSPGPAALFAYEDYAAEVLPWIVLPQGQYPVMLAHRLRGVAEMNNPLGNWSPEYLSVADAACAAGSPPQ